MQNRGYRHDDSSNGNSDFFKVGGILLLVVSIILSIEIRLTPFYLEAGEEWCRKVVVEQAQKIVEESAKNWPDIDELLTFGYNNDGSLSWVRAETKDVNIIQGEISSRMNEELPKLLKEGFQVEAGTLSNSWILSGRGPSVKVKAGTTGYIQAQINSELGKSSSGINQSMYRVTIDITAPIMLLFPTGSKHFTVDMEFILLETVIVGKVPFSS